MTKTHEDTGRDPAPSIADRLKGAAALAGRNRGTIAAVGALAALAGSALFNRARAKAAEEANPPEGRFVEVDGTRLHYVERGEGRPVLLLHGNGAMVQDWEASGVMALVAARYRVIAFDRPGFGHSERPRTTLWTAERQAALIAEACREIGIERPIVVGHSWGTLVAVAMALDFPGQVAALVLASGYYFPTARLDVPVLSPPAVPLFGDVMRYTVSPIVGRLATPLMTRAIFAPLPVPESFASFPVEMSLRPSQLRATAADTALMVPAAVSLSGRFDELSLPVEIVAGDGDQIVDFDSHSQRLADRIDGAAIHKVPGAGHMVHYAAPEELVASIDRAAERVDEGMRPAKVRAVLFDVDGTLVDSNDLHADAWVETFRHFGFDIPRDRIRGQIGKGGDNLIPSLLPQLSEKEVAEIDAYRGTLFKRDYIDRVKAFPGVCALFQRLRDDGLSVVLATSSAKVELDHHLDLLGCGDLVTAATSRDDAGSSKPDPDIFAAALKAARVKPGEALVVGDTPYDVEAAAKAGIRTIALRSGGFDEKALREAGAIALFDGPADLLARYGESPLA